ncbi:L-threonylcarbamoyladenylate synthase [Cerasicoccus fimbriatus]|uniref:L-threonylcarbamoyladenylate synthase n=1 Tax=Cerasicoccus fimbriatus TaxID=3014554 RepID=UPI0022B52A9B|nr:L-threonylcarbamoyladenylate synthase [Cerasicoccus sp. TK19100]
MDAALPAFISGSEAGIQQAAQLLQSGHCVAVPTETVYGLAGDAMNEAAVRQIFAIKSRPFIDPLIVHLHDFDQLHDLTQLNESQLTAARRLDEAFWPGPLTLVLPKHERVHDLVTANRDSVAIRRPAHPIMRKLLEASKLYLAAPSANPFGYISPTTAQHVRDSLNERCPHILDGGPCESGLESTIVDLREPERPILLRPGPIGKEMIESVLGVEVSLPAPTSDSSLAPGMLERHYSPTTRLLLHPAGQLPSVSEVEARIYLKRPPFSDGKHDYWLSESGELPEVAKNLFSLLRTLDALEGIQAIHCEQPPPGPGIANAIRDRLGRASKR